MRRTFSSELRHQNKSEVPKSCACVPSTRLWCERSVLNLGQDRRGAPAHRRLRPRSLKGEAGPPAGTHRHKRFQYRDSHHAGAELKGRSLGAVPRHRNGPRPRGHRDEISPHVSLAHWSTYRPGARNRAGTVGKSLGPSCVTPLSSGEAYFGDGQFDDRSFKDQLEPRGQSRLSYGGLDPRRASTRGPFSIASGGSASRASSEQH
jgi:hypothetical protein